MKRTDWRQATTWALDLVFPPRCVGCGRFGSFLCSSCRHTFGPVPPPLCTKCGRPIRQGMVCSSCKTSPLDIDGVRSAFLFTGVVREAIHSLKYKGMRALAAPLASPMADYVRSHVLPADVIIPVPLHEKRLRERGFNQSHLLALELGKSLGLAVRSQLLLRSRHTTPQAKTSSVEERRRNVSGAFACTDAAVQDCRVLVIDDVCTSGATLEACAVALKQAGARSVWGLTLAREA